MSDGPRVMVTGARGMLGSALVGHLRGSGFNVIELNRTGSGDVTADLADSVQVDAALDQACPDIIVNLAALTNVDTCENNPHAAYLANVLGVENVARWAGAGGGRAGLIHVSTDQVYDGNGPHGERDVTITNCYGLSKYSGEVAAALAGATILRTNFFGASAASGRQSLSDWIVRSLRGNQAIIVFEDIRFSALSLRALVREMERVILRPRPGVFNLGARDGMSKADFAFGLAGALGLQTGTMTRGSSRSAGFKAYRPTDMRMKLQKYENEYDVQLPTMQDEILSMRAEYACAR